MARREGLSQDTLDAIDAIALSFRELGQSAVVAAAALHAVGEASQIVRQSIREVARMELDRRGWYDNVRWETVFDTERRIPDEARYRTPVVWPDDRFRPEYLGDPSWNPPCDCTQCRRRRDTEGWQDAVDSRTQEEEADSRSRSLLLSCLSPIQREEFEFGESFTIIAKSGYRYRIERGYNFNIAVLGKNGKSTIGRLCAGPDEDVPVYDSMLSQKLWLENDEEGFLRVANRDGFFDESPMGQPVFIGCNIVPMDSPPSASAIRYAYRGR